MRKDLERLLARTVQVLDGGPAASGWSLGTALADGEAHPCYRCGGAPGPLPVAAYGERPDGSHVLVCGEGHIIKPEITAALGAREPDTVWTCRYEHSCGALLFTRGPMRRYLVIEGTGGHIGFPKGHMEEGETIEQAVSRELREEVGVTAFTYVPGYRVDAQVVTRSGRQKDVTYFLASFDPSRAGVRRQEEEIVHIWLLEYEQARERVNTALDRELLDRAEALLAQKEPS